MPIARTGLVADGNIYPNRFLQMASTAFRCVQADGTAPIVGISGNATKYPPQPEISNTYHAEQHDPVDARMMGEADVLLCLGGTVTPGQLLVSDSSGKGVAAQTGTLTTAQFVGARAIEGGSANDLIRVEVLPITYTPA